MTRNGKGAPERGQDGTGSAIEGERAALRDLQRIPGVGPSIARDLLGLGVRAVSDLKGQDPEALYDAFCVKEGMKVDRCWLYVARCAVYFASRKRHDPEKLKWWAWKD